MDQETLEKLNDIQLLALCQQGQDAAFNVLYNRYRLQLYSYLHRLLPGKSDHVDDFFQQVWIKACRNFSHYTDQQRFLAWLCRIAHNLVMDFYRANGNDEEFEVPETIAAETPSPDHALRDQQLETTLEDAIAKLPEEQREIIQLRNQGIAFKDIADRKNISLNTALGRMHYAIMNLRKMLADYL